MLKTSSYFSQYEVLLVKWEVTDRFCIDCTARGSNGCFCFVAVLVEVYASSLLGDRGNCSEPINYEVFVPCSRPGGKAGEDE